ncbi:retrovirus-related pol polyprotein from transposon 17.6 [Tanacetum coccineum]
MEATVRTRITEGTCKLRAMFLHLIHEVSTIDFKETEGVVGLIQWMRKMESVFNISGCAIENQVKFATCTLLGAALTWWNGQIRTLGPEAYAMTWEVLKKKMTDKYCPQEMDSTGVLKSVLKSSSTGGTGLASKVRNIEGNLRMPMRSVTFTKPLNDKVAAVNEASLGDIPHITKEKDPIQAKEKLSFASVVNEQPLKKAVKIKELRNELSVNGAAVTIPIEAVEAVNARFINTLYGYFIGDRLAFPLVENYVKNTWAKYGLKRIQLHEEFFLFQFDTREGMESVLENGPWLIRRVPLILNEWTPNFKRLFGRSIYLLCC